jgi:hypothetical protein
MHRPPRCENSIIQPSVIKEPRSYKLSDGSSIRDCDIFPLHPYTNNISIITQVDPLFKQRLGAVVGEKIPRAPTVREMAFYLKGIEFKPDFKFPNNITETQCRCRTNL